MAFELVTVGMTRQEGEVLACILRLRREEPVDASFTGEQNGSRCALSADGTSALPVLSRLPNHSKP